MTKEEEQRLLALIPREIKREIAADGDGIHETLTKLVLNYEILSGRWQATE